MANRLKLNLPSDSLYRQDLQILLNQEIFNPEHLPESDLVQRTKVSVNLFQDDTLFLLLPPLSFLLLCWQYCPLLRTNSIPPQYVYAFK